MEWLGSFKPAYLNTSNFNVLSRAVSLFEKSLIIEKAFSSSKSNESGHFRIAALVKILDEKNRNSEQEGARITYGPRFGNRPGQIWLTVAQPRLSLFGRLEYFNNGPYLFERSFQLLSGLLPERRRNQPYSIESFYPLDDGKAIVLVLKTGAKIFHWVLVNHQPVGAVIQNRARVSSIQLIDPSNSGFDLKLVDALDRPVAIAIRYASGRTRKLLGSVGGVSSSAPLEIRSQHLGYRHGDVEVPESWWFQEISD